MQKAPLKHARHAASKPTSATSASADSADSTVSAWRRVSIRNRKGAGDQWMHALRGAVRVILAIALSAAGGAAWAQANGPVVSNNADPDTRDGLGNATRALLSLQVSGAAAGPQQPMTGDATSAAYKRYTDSFTHPVPEFFQQRVRSDSSGGS